MLGEWLEAGCSTAAADRATEGDKRAPELPGATEGPLSPPTTATATLTTPL